MKKFLSILGIGLMLSPSLPSFAQENVNNIDENQVKLTGEARVLTMGTILEDNVHFRSAPGLSSTIYLQLHKGFQVTIDYNPNIFVYKDGYKWVPCSWGSLNGWVAANYVDIF